MFDLNSQSGVMVILASIRASNLATAEKNELRDLVFLYTNGGRDQSVKIAIEQKLAHHQLKPVSAIKTAASSSPAFPFGTSRPVPVFKTPTKSNPLPVTPTDSTLKTDQVATPEEAGQAKVRVSIPDPISSPAVKTAPPAGQVSSSISSGSSLGGNENSFGSRVGAIPNVAPALPQTKVESNPMPEVEVQSPVQPKVVEPEPTPAATNYLDRIKAIKSAVNSQVGNPVNLVDINNEVGREYMNALLEAMKKLSAGAESELPSAMARLETAYVAVEAAIKQHQEKNRPKPSAQSIVNHDEVFTATDAASGNSLAALSPNQSSSIDPLETQSPINSAYDNEPLTLDQNQPANEPIFKPAPPRIFPVEDKPVASLSSNQDSRFPGIAPTKNVVLDTPSNRSPIPVVPPTPRRDNSSVPPIPIAPTVPSSKPKPVSPEPIPTPVAPSPITPAPTTSLADTPPLRTPSELRDPASVSTSRVQGDPLMTEEVDAGLDQLLSDWVLFKKSGFLGRGPKGREHPLFKKIADLPVPLLLAGRFEGATQEVRQSITDYMNGWRYEQGIIYEQGETFERYLRRVIRHILDLQKSSKSS